MSVPVTYAPYSEQLVHSSSVRDALLNINNANGISQSASSVRDILMLKDREKHIS